MQNCLAFPLHPLVGFLVAAQCSALQWEQPAEQNGFTLVSSDVEYAKGLINCPHGVLADDAGTCEEMSLLLDIYAPNGTLEQTSGDLMPALLIVHGGANAAGDKEQVLHNANFFASVGYVVFVPNYRLQGHNGNYPGEDFETHMSLWSSLYPAVRDVKAAFRYIVSNSDDFHVNVSRVTAVGVSAGAMDVLAAFAPNNNSQFTSEFSWAEDPTLSTVNADVNATAQAIIMKSGNAWGLESYSTFSGEPPLWDSNGHVVGGVRPLMQFHGTADSIIPFEHANTAASYWSQAGAQSCLQVMEGVGHLNFDTSDTSTHTYDIMALQFLASVEANPTGKVCCPGVDPDEC